MWLNDLLKFKEMASMSCDCRPAFVFNIDNNKSYNSYMTDIINLKKGVSSMDREEYINGFIARRDELANEKLVLENTNLDVLVEEKFAEVRNGIREEVEKEHREKIADKECEILAIQRIIDREVAKLEEEKKLEEENNIEE